MLFPNPQVIIKKIEEIYYLSPGSIIGPARAGVRVEAREVAVYILHKLTPYSWPEIGEVMSRDHSSVMDCYDRFVNEKEDSKKKRKNLAVDLVLKSLGEKI